MQKEPKRSNIVRKQARRRCWKNAGSWRVQLPVNKGEAHRTAVAKSSLFEYFTCISELPLSNHGRESIYLHQLAPRLLLHGVLRPRHLRLLLDHNALSPTYLSVLFATYRLPKDWGECRLGGEFELNMIIVNTARYNESLSMTNHNRLYFQGVSKQPRQLSSACDQMREVEGIFHMYFRAPPEQPWQGVNLSTSARP